MNGVPANKSTKTPTKISIQRKLFSPPSRAAFSENHLSSPPIFEPQDLINTKTTPKKWISSTLIETKKVKPQNFKKIEIQVIFLGNL
jgi:hypothetical protein